VRDLPFPADSLPANNRTMQAKQITESYSNIRANYLPEHADIFASQEGEDILLKRILKNYYYTPGTFVDVGAHDPIRFSNTYHYYLRGWRGINIDPIPNMRRRFNTIRPQDTNLDIGISTNAGTLQYYTFKEPAFNTFNPENAEYAKTRTEQLGVKDVSVSPLKDVLQKHLNTDLDFIFLNIDVEGLELDVLKSNDWSLFRPKVIIVEALDDESLSVLNEYLNTQNYQKVASTKNSFFFCDNKFWEEVK